MSGDQMSVDQMSGDQMSGHGNAGFHSWKYLLHDKQTWVNLFDGLRDVSSTLQLRDAWLVFWNRSTVQNRNSARMPVLNFYWCDKTTDWYHSLTLLSLFFENCIQNEDCFVAFHEKKYLDFKICEPTLDGPGAAAALAFT